MTPEELAAAQRQVEQYGVRAKQIVQELIDCYHAQNHHRGGQLCQEIYQTPDLLLLVVGMLTTLVAKNGPLATPEEMGMDSTEEVERTRTPMEIAALDQMSAAAEERDINVFSQIALDAQVQAFLYDARQMGMSADEIPDVETLMRSYLTMDRGTVVALAAEGLRRLLKQEMDRG